MQIFTLHNIHVHVCIFQESPAPHQECSVPLERSVLPSTPGAPFRKPSLQSRGGERGMHTKRQLHSASLAEHDTPPSWLRASAWLSTGPASCEEEEERGDGDGVCAGVGYVASRERCLVLSERYTCTCTCM